MGMKCSFCIFLYADRGISAKDILHRPEMRHLLEDAKRHKFDIVIFWALSRFTRSVQDLYFTMESFKKLGIDMISYTESFDTSSPMGRAMIGIIGIFAQLERELTGERVAAALRERAEESAFVPTSSAMIWPERILSLLTPKSPNMCDSVLITITKPRIFQELQKKPIVADIKASAASLRPPGVFKKS